MWTETKDGLYLERTMKLKSNSPSLSLAYRIKNNSDSKKEFIWANHPDLTCGPSDATESNQIVILTQDKGLLIQDYKRSVSKSEYLPAENWILAHDRESCEYFLQEFDRRLVNKIGVWEGIGFYTMELLFKPVVIAPGKEFIFKVKYSTGKENLEDLLKKLGKK